MNRPLGRGALRTLSYLFACALAWACSADIDDDASGTGGEADPPSSGASGGGEAVPGSGGTNPGSGGDGTGNMETGGTGGQPGSGGLDGGGDDVPDSLSCADVADWPADWVAREEEILALVNQYRAAGATCGGNARPPAEPLTMDPVLRCAARLHSMDMAERDFFSHATWDASADTCSDDDECDAGYICGTEFPQMDPQRCGKSPALRVSEVGGPSGAGWENIAAGNSTAAETMDEQWMPSSGHCNNIMDGSLQTIGVGYYGGAGTYNHYWTQSFDN